MRRLIRNFEIVFVLIAAFVIIVVLPTLNAIIDCSCTPGALNDIPGLAAKLSVGHSGELGDAAPPAPAQPVKQDAVSAFLWQHISQDDRKILADPKSAIGEKQRVLLENLNKVIMGPLIYDEQRFTGVALSQPTFKLLASNPDGLAQQWLNRLLLDDVYSNELKSAAYTPLPGWLQVSNFSIGLYGKYLCYAILAISVDILWGYTGLLSLGQCLFFSLGGYMMGMYLMRMIGSLGQEQAANPDFLWGFIGWRTLPWFWKPFASFGFAVAMGFLLPGLLSLAFGYLAFRSRIRGVYFSILTQALTFAANLLFFRNALLMGGNNGFTDFKFIHGHDIRLPSTQRALFICAGLLLLVCYLLCKWLADTKFGKIQRAVRDSENRLLFSGYATANFKLFIFVLSALIASAAGMLYVPLVGIINPSEMAPDKSIEAVIWVAIGGRGTLVGPIIGAIFVNALRSWATRAFPDLWLIILGLMAILVVLFMPKGLVGLFGQLRDLFKKQNKESPPATVEATPSAAAELSSHPVVTKTYL